MTKRYIDEMTLPEIKEYYRKRQLEELAELGHTEVKWDSHWVKLITEKDEVSQKEKTLKPYLAVISLKDDGEKFNYTFLECSEEKGKGTQKATYNGTMLIGTILRGRVARKDNSEPVQVFYQATAEGLREIPDEDVKELLGTI